MNNLIYILQQKKILLVFLLFLSNSYAIDDFNYNNFNLTNNELITESIIGNLGINLANTSFWFGAIFIVKKLIDFIKHRNKSEHGFIGTDDRNNTKDIAINATMINLAEISLINNFYKVLPNNYILLAIKTAGFLGAIKFSKTKDKTKHEIFNRIILLILLENIITIIPNSLYNHYEEKYPLEYKDKMNAAGVAISTTSSLLASMYIYDIAFNKTSSKIKSLAFFLLSNLTIGVMSSLIASAIIQHNIEDISVKSIWNCQLLGSCIFTLINSVSIFVSFPKIKGYIPYLYSCLIAAYGFSNILFILTLLESMLLNNNFCHGATSDALGVGVLTFASIPCTLLFINTLAAILTYNYGEKIIEKLQLSNKTLPILALGTISATGITIASAGLMSFSYTQPFKQSLLYLNQMVLRKFYNIIPYVKWALKI